MNINSSIEREFRYIIEWFTEWSELQREDFIPIVVEYLEHNKFDDLLVAKLANTNISGKPLSLFQCRVKLFREWYIKWPVDFKVKLQEKIMDIDEGVGEKILSKIKKKNVEKQNENKDYDEKFISEELSAPTNNSVPQEVVAKNVIIQQTTLKSEEDLNEILDNKIIDEIEGSHITSSEHKIVNSTISNNPEVSLVA